MSTVCIVSNSNNTNLLTQMLDPPYQVLSVEDTRLPKQHCDLFIVDYYTLGKSLPNVRLRKEALLPAYVPVLLLIPQGKVNGLSEEVWDTVDEVLEMPLHKRRLNLTLSALLRMRNYSLQLYEATVAKDKFFSIVTHDLKTPFNALMALSEQFIENYDAYGIEDRRKLSFRIHNSLTYTAKLLDNLLQWSQSKMGRLDRHFERVNLKTLAKHSMIVLKESADSKNIALYLDMEEDVIVHVDVNMLATVIRNLVSNAIKFTPSGGEIRISSSTHSDFVEMTVADTGIGIKEDDMDRLFSTELKRSTYGTDGERGTGLGLAICKEFIEKHQGKIWVESQWGNGSRFKFSLPRSVIPLSRTRGELPQKIPDFDSVLSFSPDFRRGSP